LETNETPAATCSFDNRRLGAMLGVAWMWSRTITWACVSALTLYAGASLHAESQLFDDIAEQSLLVPQRVAVLPAEITPSHETSQPLGILTAEQIQPESQSIADNTGDGSYDSCCHLIPTSKMCPCSYGWAEGLLLWRDNQSTNRPIVINLNTQDTLIAPDDLNFDSGWGIRAGFGIRRCDNLGWEFEYLGVFDQNAGRSVELADELALPGDLGVTTNNFFFADEVSVRYSSQINNAEVNRVCCCCSCDGPCSCRSVEWLYGFRYLNLNEDFSIVSTDLQEGTSTYDIDTNNNLFGAQIGNRVRESRGRWSWEGTGKAGIFGNAAEQHSDPIVDFPAFVVRPGRSESGGNVAFVGDLNLTAIYQLNSVWGARLGYNLIWIEGVALAPDQLDFSIANESDISTDGGILLHGVNAGLEARW
jgi:Putative beta barrel porin-7 (BBP7)